MRVQQLLMAAAAVGLTAGSTPAQAPTAPAPTPPAATSSVLVNGVPYVPGDVYPAQATDSSAMTVLTGPTTNQPPIGKYGVPPPSVEGLPPGSVTSPWCGARPAGWCCGPTGRNGPIGYELYTFTGPNQVIGGDDFSKTLNTGWTVGGGGRSLFFNRPGDAAWVLDLGLSYTYNQGDATDVLGVFTPAPLDTTTNQPTAPDQVNSFRVRGLARTNFNVAIGRDWFLNGPGNNGSTGNNCRVGTAFGGAWGTSHVDLVPVADVTNYLRKSGVTHGIFGSAHADWERPVGGWVLFFGGELRLGYTWADLVPPVGSDILDLNFLLRLGVRY